MQTFVTIVDAGSLTGAAEVLGKALPTVVRSLATLEHELDVRLLQRTTRRMSLTAEGRMYLDRCRRILTDVEDAEHALAGQLTEPLGRLRVTAPVLFGQLRVVPALAGLLRAHPKLTVDLVLLDRVIDLVEEGIDVGIRIAPLSDSSMIATRIGEQRRVVVASPSLLRRVGPPKHPHQLATLPVVDVHRPSATSTWRFEDQGRAVSVAVRGPLACNQVAAGVEACAQGLGFGRFLGYQVRERIAAKQLRVVLKAFEPPPIPVHLVFAHARLISPRVRVFVDWMKAQL